MENIHKIIREKRLSKDMTLKELGELTNLSIGFLSQVERGTSSLAITSLKKIADALDIEMVEFFTKRTPVQYPIKLADQVPFQTIGSDATFIQLSGNFPNRKLEVLKSKIQPLQSDHFSFSHQGEEFHYVLEGAVIFVVEEEEYYLEKGEAIHFPSNIKHLWKNPLNRESILLSALTPVLIK